MARSLSRIPRSRPGKEVSELAPMGRSVSRRIVFHTDPAMADILATLDDPERFIRQVLLCALVNGQVASTECDRSSTTS